MAKNIRAEYMKNLMADKKNLEEGLKSTTKDSLKTILSESVENGLRQILAEAQEEPEVEEVDTENENMFDDEPETGESEESEDLGIESGDDNGDTEETEEITISDDEDGVESGEPEEEGDTDDEEMWNELEQYKDEDGEYDLTSMDKDSVIKVLKVMKPEDGVRVVKNNNGSVTLTDDETEKEYIIDLEGDFEGEGGEELDAEEIDLNEGNVNLGYTDNYQNKTAMTMPNDDNAGGEFDAGAPKGNGKRWVGHKGANGGNPYSQKVNEMDECGGAMSEEPLYEVELECADECGLKEQSRFGKANEKGMHKTPKSENDSTVYGAHVISREGNYKGNEPGLTNEQAIRNIKRKANTIFMENKELKQIAEQFKDKLNEAVVINASLAKIIKLVTENTTTRDEKLDIVNRFNKVSTLNEGKELYNKISEELKRTHPINNTQTVFNGQLQEAKQAGNQMLMETTLLQSNDLSDTLEFMKRLDSVK